ncbi:MAG: DUF4177 domain-containing protein [Pseudorhodobacter sp.]|nr:DUF4177 domain-containing protein [Pseudorhodobacter sp.]
MQHFEYKVVPAPRRGEKTRDAKTTPDRFAAALTRLMNELAREGWDYLRADTLPCDERAGLTGTATHFQNMLVFRRALPEQTAALSPESLPDAAPLLAAPAAIPAPHPVLSIVSAEGPSPALGPARQTGKAAPEQAP